ncbi:glycosyltransferase family 39 protein [Candidatus Gottesmanbacteria bacterium]|nr:glycosyltransferase family 39 protein [Candidatus Gottesmanbacteria bacterium]
MTIRQKLLVVAVLLLGTFLRLHKYDVYPQRGATSDEYTYSFLGQSLLTRGIPISWSYFGAYKNRKDLTINKLYFPIVWPYFDHPPLNGIIVATWAIAKGETTFEQITLSTIRQVPVVLTVISSVLLFLLLYRTYGYGVGLLALVIYSTSTIMVVSSRVVMAENLLTPLLLGALLYYEHVRKHLRLQQAVILGILCGLAIWTKELGIVVFFSVVAFLFYDRAKIQMIGIIVAILLLAVLGYVFYGFLYDKEVFLAIVATQASRMVGPETLLSLVSRPVLINKVFYDGWYLFGTIAVFASFADLKKHFRILVPFFIYFVLLVGSLTRQGEMGWYMIVAYPFLSAAAAIVLGDWWKKPNGMMLVACLIVGLSLFHYLIELPFGITLTRFRLFLGIVFVPYLIASMLRYEALIVRIQKGMMAVLVLSTTILTYFYTHPA